MEEKPKPKMWLSVEEYSAELLLAKQQTTAKRLQLQQVQEELELAKANEKEAADRLHGALQQANNALKQRKDLSNAD